MKKITIGIPRALLYYRYQTLWKCFFEGLGCKVIVSDNNWKQISAKKCSQKLKDNKEKEHKQNIKEEDNKEEEKRDYNYDDQDYEYGRGHRYVGRFRFMRRFNVNRGFRGFRCRRVNFRK